MSDSTKDRVDGAGDKVSGSIKEGVGKLAGDEQTENEGKADQAKGDLKQGIADVKDKVSDAVKKITH
ncbi:MAG TPA: CsbD family protein [Thermomicrobiales bacterium]|nr:CsbD family protein [Thermomicrobiales bacterium]